jgi:hypothetical protein
MSVWNRAARTVHARVLAHLLRRIDAAAAETEPFSHAYFEDVFPQDVYRDMLAHLPDTTKYTTAAERHSDDEGHYVRSMYSLTTAGVDQLPAAARELWCGVAAALADPEVKRRVFEKIAPDLAFRYGVAAAAVPDLPGFSRPVLYRETEGFEIAPHPDTRKKIVTMHLYLPADLSQIGLGTALYRRKPLGLPFGHWRHRFAKVKQFEFRPNSGYAFVVNNTLTKRSWHGREKLPEGAGVRNTLLNTFYAEPREGYSGYLGEAAPARKAA